MSKVIVAFRVKSSEKELLQKIADTEGCDISDLCRRGLTLLHLERRMLNTIANQSLKASQAYPPQSMTVVGIK